jgi:prepilin-type N-terminal cleavage/methylation domain-containing protein
MIVKENDGAAILNPRRGFTTVELLVVISIILILAAITFLNLSGWARNQRLKGVARDLMSHFQFARLEAIKRSTTIALAFNPGNGGVGNYTVFVDDGAGGGTPGNLIQDNEAESTLRRAIMPLGVTLESTTFTSDRAGYNARGFPVLGNGGTVRLRTDPPGRSYEVVMQQISGGLSLNGPL